LQHVLLFDLADVIVAVDVRNRSPKRRTPSPVASMFSAVQIMQATITAQKIRLRAPDILAGQKLNISLFLFFLRATEDSEEELKLMIGGQMKAYQTA
jgi:hypothetical protein